MKAFMDATGGLWQTGALVGKPAGVFVSTGCQGGGQEATVMSTLPFFAAHGMPFVPIGYSWGGKQFDVEKLRGGGCWGAQRAVPPARRHEQPLSARLTDYAPQEACLIRAFS